MVASPRVWKEEADVLIVGSGGAALSAAIAAVQAGERVIVFEKGDFVGGTTRWSDGAYYIANNHFLREKGVAPGPDDLLHQLARQ